MAEQKDKDKVREATTAAPVKAADLAALLPPMTGSLLPEGTAVKLFPSAKDFPAENQNMAKESAAKPLKITRSKADVSSGYAYLKRLQVMKDMLAGAADFT